MEPLELLVARVGVEPLDPPQELSSVTVASAVESVAAGVRRGATDGMIAGV